VALTDVIACSSRATGPSRSGLRRAREIAGLLDRVAIEGGLTVR
jgi:hypothetical protein